jgi:hypothetical protein
MVVAAASVMAFGCLGIAAITGRIHFGNVKAPKDAPASLLGAEANVPLAVGAIGAAGSVESRASARSARPGN